LEIGAAQPLPVAPASASVFLQLTLVFSHPDSARQSFVAPVKTNEPARCSGQVWLHLKPLPSNSDLTG
jgi:hypothetical protein